MAPEEGLEKISPTIHFSKISQLLNVGIPKKCLATWRFAWIAYLSGGRKLTVDSVKDSFIVVPSLRKAGGKEHPTDAVPVMVWTSGAWTMFMMTLFDIVRLSPCYCGRAEAHTTRSITMHDLKDCGRCMSSVGYNAMRKNCTIKE